MNRASFNVLIFNKEALIRTKRFFLVVFVFMSLGVVSSYAQSYVDVKEAFTLLKSEIDKHQSTTLANTNANASVDVASHVFYVMMFENLEKANNVETALKNTFEAPNFTGKKKEAASKAESRIKALLTK